jgi:tagaturonate epimerase
MDPHKITPIVINLPGLRVHESSITHHEALSYSLVESDDGQNQLAIEAPAQSTSLADFDGKSQMLHNRTLILGPLNARNASALRNRLSWLRPAVQGLRTGIGFGDRLGLATPGHLRALRATKGHLVPFPAQQSIREMNRTGRTPQQVMDDAMWGVFAEGWQAGFGADADHLKTPQDIDSCLAVGYTFFTFDPGEYVNSTVENLPANELHTMLDKFPWEQLEDTSTDAATRYLSAPVLCEEHSIPFNESILMRAILKYGRAIAHVVRLFRHLAQVGANHEWEVEISIDETARPTTPSEHIYIATELRRLGVRWVSLAPRFVGKFEKGVDYIGDVEAFEHDIDVHAAIARTLGPYKIGLHSGSDKFSIYAAAARQTHGMLHLKTAGTSYLEALRTIAVLDPELLRSIYTCAREHYEEDKASYHVSAQLESAPLPSSLSNTALPMLLDQFDAREILHVTFGTILTKQTTDGHRLFYERLITLLKTHPEAYAANLQTHFLRHLQPLVKYASNSSTILP